MPTAKMLLVIGLVIGSLSCQAQKQRLKWLEPQDLFLRAGVAQTVNLVGSDYFWEREANALSRQITSPYVGVESSVIIRKKVQLYYGLQWLNKGIKGQAHGTNNGTTIFHLNYQYTQSWLELPLYWHLAYRKFGFNLGLNASFLLRSNFSGDYVSTNPPLKISYYNTITRQYHRWDYGLRLGVQYKISKKLDLECWFQNNFVQSYKFRNYEQGLSRTYFIGFQYRPFSNH